MIYLWINILTILFPLLLSFDKKVAFYSKWKYLFPAILVVGVFFIVWDVIFTANGVWSFNEKYLVGIYFFGLPLEEILFFLTVPYASVFIYECVVCYFPDLNEKLQKISQITTWFLMGFILISAIFYIDRIYTFTTLTFLFLTFSIAYFRVGANNLGHFYTAYIIHLIPFLLVNGILTAIPIVLYNDMENVGIRIYTIPIEDTAYSMLLLLLNILIFEFLRNYKQLKTSINL
jgi:lycopene cyclase domain-containing protein